MMEYNPKEIEKKWQDLWEVEKTFCASEDKSKPKYYTLIEFPYPSGQGLHVGHPRPYTALDIVSRKRRLQGYNVLFPIGWDAFGLPTENYAIKNKIHPKTVTERNVARFKLQLKSLGLSFDWSREINTTDPEYYKWTQWIFLKLFEKGLAYKKETPINWCTECKVGLANEEVVDGVCDRCGSQVVRKIKNQWMLKITEYAEKLIKDLDLVDYIDRVKIQQKNWIGRSEGMEVDFNTTEGNTLRVYTTRPDTLFGATYMVVSPEHPMIEELKEKITNYTALAEYRDFASKKSDFERTELVKEKTGVQILGIMAVNPVNGKQIPIWVSDYVLMSYGTGAIMAVPGHDTRDWEFAKKFNLPIIEVVAGGNVEEAPFTEIESGMMINSEFLNGLDISAAKKKISDWLEEKKLGQRKVNFKLRDWVFSRQRYWGEPIPLVYCEKCGWVPVPEDQLPLLLPDVESYEPTDNGESPLAKMSEWVSTTCPKCGGPGQRETDTRSRVALGDGHDQAQVGLDEMILGAFAPCDDLGEVAEHTLVALRSKITEPFPSQHARLDRAREGDFLGRAKQWHSPDLSQIQPDQVGRWRRRVRGEEGVRVELVLRAKQIKCLGALHGCCWQVPGLEGCADAAAGGSAEHVADQHALLGWDTPRRHHIRGLRNVGGLRDRPVRARAFPGG